MRRKVKMLKFYQSELVSMPARVCVHESAPGKGPVNEAQFMNTAES